MSRPDSSTPSTFQGYDELPDDYLAPNGLPYLSVSQLESADAEPEEEGGPRGGCWHKWGLRYLDRLRMPPHPSAVVGSRVHVIADDWLTLGKPAPEAEVMTTIEKVYDHRLGGKVEKEVIYYPGQIFNAGVRLLRAPGTVKVEGKFRFSTSLLGRPIYWQGAKDMEWADDLVHIGDHKTTRDWRYQKTEPVLRKDGQANLYAVEAMYRFRATQVGLDWITYHTRKPEGRATRIVVQKPQAEERVAKLERTAQKLLTLYHLHSQGQLKTSELPKRLTTCKSFGGCPYAGTKHCEISTEDLFESGRSNVTNQFASFLNDIDTRLGSTGGAQAALAPQVQAPVPTPVQQAQSFVPPVGVSVVPPPVVAQPVPVVAPAVSRPTHWMPGDPMNATQEYLLSAKAPLSMIANAADVPPSPEVAASYDHPAPTVAQPAPSFGAVHATLTPQDVVNAPEAIGRAPIATPDQLPIAEAPVQAQGPSRAPDQFDAMTRAQLKDFGIKLGLWDAGCRNQEPRMRDEIRAKVAAGGLAAVTVPAGAQAAFEAAMAPQVVPAPVPQVVQPAQPVPVVQAPHVVQQQALAEVFANAPAHEPVAVGGGKTGLDAKANQDAERDAYAQSRGFVKVEGGYAKPSLKLFVNCAPKHYTGLYFADVLRAVMPRVRELSGVGDYRTTEYGKGAGYLANEVRTYLLANPLDALVVDSRTPEGTVCLGVLEELAADVVRGF